jgi:hypothetical protein
MADIGVPKIIIQLYRFLCASLTSESGVLGMHAKPKVRDFPNNSKLLLLCLFNFGTIFQRI